MTRYFEPKKYILTAAWDTFLSRVEYDDFIENNNVLTFGSRQTDFMVVSPNVNPHDDKMFSKSELRKMSMDDLNEFYYYLISSSCYYEPNKKEKVEELSEVTVAEYYEWLYDYTRWYDLPRDFISRGYSQVDAVMVLYHKSKPYSKEVIDNILWDTPARIRLEDIETGEEWYLDEYMDSLYEYDKDELLNAIQDELPKDAYDFLVEYMPNELSYM